MGASMICDLAVAIIRDGKVPSDSDSEFHCLEGKRGRIGKRQLPRSQADRADYENPGEDCGQPHQTIPSLVSSQAEALQMQSLLSGSCKRSI